MVIGITRLKRLFSKFYCRHHELVSKFNVGLISLLHQGLSEPEFYGDLVYKVKNIMNRTDFFLISSEQIIIRHKHIGYSFYATVCMLNDSPNNG